MDKEIRIRTSTAPFVECKYTNQKNKHQILRIENSFFWSFVDHSSQMNLNKYMYIHKHKHSYINIECHMNCVIDFDSW